MATHSEHLETLEAVIATALNIVKNRTLADLSLSEIKSGRIDGANLPGAVWQRCCRRPGKRVKPAHPCAATSAYEPGCNSFVTI